MNKIITKTIKITSNKMPPDVDFIENQLKEMNLNPIRWAIVDIQGNTLIINVSAQICKDI